MSTLTPRAATLSKYVEALSTDDEFVAACADQAGHLVNAFIGAGNPWKVPPAVVERAVLEVGADLYARRTQTAGVDDFADATPSPFRVTRNPMTAAYSLLRPWLPVSIG